MSAEEAARTSEGPAPWNSPLSRDSPAVSSRRPASRPRPGEVPALPQPHAARTLVIAGGLPQQARVPPRRPSPGPRTLHYLTRYPPFLSLPMGPLGADVRPAKPGAPLPALLLLALALSLHDSQGRPRGLRGARVTDEEPKPWLFLPVARVSSASSVSRAAGKSRSSPILCSEPGS